MLDTFKTKGLRKKLAEEIKDKGIYDANVLDAIATIPRHLFIDSSFLEFAYLDKPFPIGEGQTISQPYTVAFQTQLLKVQAGDKILEIGTGSGYQAAVLALLGAKVYSIERQKNLFLHTKELLKKLNYMVQTFFGDGYIGLPAYAPFNKIIITCGAPIIPQTLLDQLKVGGIMVIPLGQNEQVMTTVTKISETETKIEEHGLFRFVPMLGNKSN